MFDTLTEGFKTAKQALTGKAAITEENITPALEAIRKSLLDADVDYNVAKNFLESVKTKSLGTEVKTRTGKGLDRKKISTSDYFTAICEDELASLMGPVEETLEFSPNKPHVIMMVGLQGSGKTTSSAKLTKFLIEQYNRKPMLVAADIYRPAAVEQLKTLGNKLNVPVYAQTNMSPPDICKTALEHSKILGCDTVILDTAGRITIDQDLMNELSDIKQVCKPNHIFLVIDAMIGQDSVRTAKAFHDQVGVSSVIITKLDGDARGGAALSIKQVIGRPIQFVGNGEDISKLEWFRPEGMATRILGMGDIVGLVKDFEKVASKEREEEALRMLKGQFSFKDFYEQISMIQKMGSLKDLMAKLPMQGLIPKGVDVDDGELGEIKVIINSMTEKERLQPNLMNQSRIRRIAKGSGRSEKDVNELISRFKTMQTMMSQFGKGFGGMGGLLGKIPGLGGFGGGMGNMQKMAQQMMGGGLPGMFGGGGAAGMGQPRTISSMDKSKLKDKRKAAKKARKKNRK